MFEAQRGRGGRGASRLLGRRSLRSRRRSLRRRRSDYLDVAAPVPSGESHLVSVHPDPAERREHSPARGADEQLLRAVLPDAPADVGQRVVLPEVGGAALVDVGRARPSRALISLEGALREPRPAAGSEHPARLLHVRESGGLREIQLPRDVRVQERREPLALALEREGRTLRVSLQVRSLHHRSLRHSLRRHRRRGSARYCTRAAEA